MAVPDFILAYGGLGVTKPMATLFLAHIYQRYNEIQRKAINSNFYLSYPFLLISKLASIEEHVRNKSRLWPVVRTYYFDRSDLSGLDELKYFQLGRKKEMLCLCLIDSLTHLSQQLTHSTCRSNFTHEKDKNSCFIHWTLIGMWT